MGFYLRFEPWENLTQRVRRPSNLEKKAELVLISSPDENILIGHCSVCPGVKFKIPGNTLQDKEATGTVRSAFQESAQGKGRSSDFLTVKSPQVPS
jgi:hypothetical protein